MDLKETDILGDDIGRHWYYESKALAMNRLLDCKSVLKILDIGAGSGFFSRYFLAHTNASEAWCIDISYDSESDEDNSGKTIHFRRSINNIEADLILLMDVLEHVDNDVALLKYYVAKVPVGSEFLITVPAFQFLWSGHDEFLEHKRRYSLKQLEGVIEKAGLKVSRGGYYFGLVFPVVFILRFAQRIGPRQGKVHSQLKRHNPIINSLLKLVCKLELSLMKFNRFAGLTVFCRAEKV